MPTTFTIQCKSKIQDAWKPNDPENAKISQTETVMKNIEERRFKVQLESGA